MVFVLDGTNKSLKFTITAGAGSDVHFTSHWADATTSGLTEGQTQGTSNGSTTVDAVAAPAASTRRVVKLITFHNTNTTLSRTVTLVNDVGGTSRTIAVFTLAPLATWYSDTAATTAIADGDKGDITVSGAGGVWTIDNDAVTTAKVVNAAITPAKLSADAQVLAFKNRIINGSMMIAQRGTSFTSTGGANNDDVYTLDRWTILSDGNDTIDVTQATDVPTGGLFSIGLDVETTNRKFGIIQFIEQRNCVGLIGNTVTLSFKAKVTTTAPPTVKLNNVKCAILAWSGTADAVTSDVVSTWNAGGTNPTLNTNWTYENTPANLNVTTSWASYSVSAAVDTSGAKNIAVFIWSDVTDTTLGDFLYITDVQLERGSTATEFEVLPIQVALSQCQRYYYSNVSGQSRFFGAPTIVSLEVLIYVPFPVHMRAQPTFSVNDVSVIVVFPFKTASFVYCDTLVGSSASTENAVLDFAATAGSVMDAGQVIFLLPGPTNNLRFNAEL